MLPEIILLKYILIYNNYNKYYKYININKDIYKELYIIYNTIPLYFDKYPEKDTTISEFAAFFWAMYPRLRPTERDVYARIFEQAANSECSEEMAIRLLTDIQLRAKAYDLAQASFEFASGAKPDKALLDEKISAFSEIKGASTLEELVPNARFVTDDLEELRNETYVKPGLRWRLATLNKSLGSLRKGDFGFVFARPETGKTTFLASEVTYMASQVDAPIIWFNNEEQGNKVKLRCYQAATGATLDELFSDPKKYKDLYTQITKNRIKIYDSGIIFKREAETIIENLQPSLIVFDQIDKIGGFVDDRDDLVMGAIYQWARNLAKKYAPVIGVCQADGSGEGLKWLTMANVALAKTAKQAEADWILGIGKSNEEDAANIRYFNISKNKLLGDPDSDPEWRHARWHVWIRPHIARYEDI